MVKLSPPQHILQTPYEILLSRLYNPSNYFSFKRTHFYLQHLPLLQRYMPAVLVYIDVSLLGPAGFVQLDEN